MYDNTSVVVVVVDVSQRGPAPRDCNKHHFHIGKSGCTTYDESSSTDNKKCVLDNFVGDECEGDEGPLRYRIFH